MPAWSEWPTKQDSRSRSHIGASSASHLEGHSARPSVEIEGLAVPAEAFHSDSVNSGRLRPYPDTAVLWRVSTGCPSLSATEDEAEHEYSR